MPGRGARKGVHAGVADVIRIAVGSEIPGVRSFAARPREMAWCTVDVVYLRHARVAVCRLMILLAPVNRTRHGSTCRGVVLSKLSSCFVSPG